MTNVVQRLVAVAGAGLLLLTAVAPASAGSAVTVRDEFNAIAFDGDDGTTSWGSDWRELPFGDGPASGQIQVVESSKCVSTKCLRLGDEILAAGIFREVDLTAVSSATLSFSYRRQITNDDDGGIGKIRVRVGTDIWSWATVATYEMNRDDGGPIAETLDISAWAGNVINVAFFGEGRLDGFIYIDNVEIAMSSNGSPSFNRSLPNRSDSEGDTIEIVPDVGDPDGDDVTFSATGLPPGISINSDDGVIAGTIGYDASSSSPYTTVVSATDGSGIADTESFIWSVADVNRPPSLLPIPDVTLGEGSPLQVNTVASDPDLPHDSLTYTLTSAPLGASVSPTGLITWTPGETVGPGSSAFTLQVSDSGSPALSVVRSFDVNVEEVNSTPTLAPIPDQAHGVGDSVSLAVRGTDTDVPTNTLTYSAIGLPAGVSINAATGVISGTISASAAQSNNTVTVTVRDNGSPRLSATRTFSWQVTRGNHAPILKAIPDQNPASGQAVSFTAIATDADSGDTLTYWVADGIDPVPPGATIGTATGRFTWIPTEDQHGATYRINVGVSDSGSPRLSDTQLVTITVPKINQPPVVADPGTQRSAEGEDVSVKISANDPDLPADSIRYRATGLPDGLRINPATGVITGVVGYAAAAGSPFGVAVTATDDGSPNQSATVEFEWQVDNTNRPPTAESTAIVAIVGVPVSVLVAVEDPDGDELEYTLGSEPIAGTLEGEGSQFVYTSPGGADKDLFSLVVSDGEFEVEAFVSIDIRTGNSAPTADTDSYDLPAGDLLRVDAPGVLANDSDLDGDVLVAELVAGPDHGRLVFNPDGSFTYTPDEGFVGGDKFIYVVADMLGEQSTATVVLNIASPVVAIPPIIDDKPRIGVLAATVPTWQAPEVVDVALATEVRRSVIAAFNGGISTLPELRFPLLLLAIALLLGLTIGRLSLLPFGVGKRQEEGWVQSYDDIHEVGRVTDDGGREIFVHRRALEKVEALVSGQRVRFVASDMRGRRIALKVWPV